MSNSTNDLKDRKLVQEVEKYRALYARKSIEFRNKNKRLEAWANISLKLDMDEELCKTRWRSIRDRFVKIYSKKITQGIDDNRDILDVNQWHLLPHLKFLKEYVNAQQVSKSGQMKQKRLIYTKFDEELIAEIKKYKAIYAHNSLEYKNKQTRLEAWAKVSRDLKVEEEICQRRWRTIRDIYVRKCAKRKLADNTSDDTDEVDWYLSPHLEFLKNYISQRKPVEEANTQPEVELEDYGFIDSNPYGDYGYSYEILESPTPAPIAPDTQRKPIEANVHEQMCNILDRFKEITEIKLQDELEASCNKNIHFLKMVDEKLSQVQLDKREDAKMFILNYLHKLTKE